MPKNKFLSRATAIVVIGPRQNWETNQEPAKNKFLSRATTIVVIGPRQIGKPTNQEPALTFRPIYWRCKAIRLSCQSETDSL